MLPTEVLAATVRDQLEHAAAQIVLAESCTAGRVAAVLGELPGISNVLCGSFVVYRNTSKTAWLDISALALADPTVGPVSAEVTERLALAILDRTPEARFGFSITGHLGPGAPPSLDGTVFCCFVERGRESEVRVDRLQLTTPTPQDANDIAGRRKRLAEATQRAFTFIADQLATTDL